ncbi:hypothetical protein E1212_26220 [Jiangella ureilytica]|uniref:GNAT family N-acetyltransferase n=1 Tax=Jiangella ureilytica TaxID=2530374 RepID=A0A4R4RCA3_9ACTN|nr:hypothetical protein [Jiangella ureilytica]TDC46747.1 hypothetical protein E1212_26220 [Jiangella ureilytica]
MTTTAARPSSALDRGPYADADLPLLQRTVAGWIPAAGRSASCRIRLLEELGFERFRVWDDVRGRGLGDDWTGQRYRAAVMDKPGYDPGREFVAESPDGRVAAFAVVWFDETTAPGTSSPSAPTATSAASASAVMAHGLRLMRERGLTTVSVNHDAENLAAAGLCRSLGFAARHRTVGYRRQIR